MLPRCETRWNLQGCPKLANRSQPLVGGSSPYYEDMWRTYRCLTSFFPIVDTCLSCEDIARQSCVMVTFSRFLWPPNVIGADISLPCDFCRLLSSFFSSPNLSGRRLDVCHTSTHEGPSVNLECMSEMCCTWLAGNAGPKKSPKMRHLGTAPSYNYVGRYLRN